jgi:hypothetical protein
MVGHRELSKVVAGDAIALWAMMPARKGFSPAPLSRMIAEEQRAAMTEGG